MPELKRGLPSLPHSPTCFETGSGLLYGQVSDRFTNWLRSTSWLMSIVLRALLGAGYIAQPSGQ